MSVDADSEREASAFWAFSLSLYSNKDVETLCLTLQDDYGFDVNIALYLIWAAIGHRREISSEPIAAIISGSADWSKHVIAPVRRLRRSLKTARSMPVAPGETDAAYAMAKRLELELERLHQKLIVRAAAGAVWEAGSDSVLTAKTNIYSYAQCLLGDALPQAARQLIDDLLAHVHNQGSGTSNHGIQS